jgi:hypothetical protein
MLGSFIVPRIFLPIMSRRDEMASIDGLIAMIDPRAIGRTALLILVLTLAAPVLGQTEIAPADALFVVRDVAVDETAQTAAQAREQALLAGQRTAYDRMLARLTMPADRARVPAADDAAIQAVVLDIEIGEERTSPVRYLARLTVRFAAAGVRQRLGAAGVPMVETPGTPVLVLPVLSIAGGALLWEDPNPWRAAWNAAPPATGLVPFVLPLGDLADTDDINAEQALAGDLERLKTIAQRYGADSVLVVEALADADPASREITLSVSAASYLGEAAPATIRSLPVADEAALPAAMAQAVSGLREEIEEAWKLAHLVLPGDDQRLTVNVPLAGLADWLEVRRRLSAVPLLRRSTLIALSQREAQLDLGFVGTALQLRSALAQRRMELTGTGETWTLRLADRASPETPTAPIRPAVPADEPDQE